MYERDRSDFIVFRWLRAVFENSVFGLTIIVFSSLYAIREHSLLIYSFLFFTIFTIDEMFALSVFLRFEFIGLLFILFTLDAK